MSDRPPEADVLLSVLPGPSVPVDRLEPVWLSLFEHHRAVAPQLGPFVTDEQSWSARRALYAELLATPDAFVVLAGRGDRVVGYALVHLRAEFADTWVVGERGAEVETLAVLPAERGAGVGSALLDAVDAELKRLGVHDVVIAVLPTNASAIAFYERRGLVPQLLHLARPAQASPATPPPRP